jgi:hypothetical protein
MLEPLGGGAPVAIPLERVASISLVATRRAGEGVRTWLADGTIVDAERPTLDGITLTVPDIRMPAEQPVLAVLSSEMRGIAFKPGAVVALASLAPEAVTLPPERAFGEKPRALDPDAALGLSPIRLQGPVAVSWRLPRAGMSLSLEAEMPPDARPWGDVILVVRDGATERARVTLRADGGESSVSDARSTAPISLVLETDRLSIELLEGSHGSVQDIVLLHRAMLAGP